MKSHSYLAEFEERGFRRGRNEGIAEGEKKGEARKQNLIIRNMLSANYPIKEIAAITDLSVDDVNRIAATLNL